MTEPIVAEASPASSRRPDGILARHRQAGRLRPQQDAELMTQGDVLGHDCRPWTKEGDERPEEESNQADHGGRLPVEKK